MLAAHSEEEAIFSPSLLLLIVRGERRFVFTFSNQRPVGLISPAGEKKIEIESYHTLTDPESGELYTLYKIAIKVDVPQELKNKRMSFSSLGDESSRK